MIVSCCVIGCTNTFDKDNPTSLLPCPQETRITKKTLDIGNQARSMRIMTACDYVRRSRIHIRQFLRKDHEDQQLLENEEHCPRAASADVMRFPRRDNKDQQLSSPPSPTPPPSTLLPFLSVVHG
uniref:Uncharacterized protein LOC111109261 n=1 Tax=Crassostrea virginica TaxID=6565 RepID=A0A8B8BCA1_CRAVI|nr:uncharacterized protein LOC111109261 [Crassostrea virginica]